MPNLHQVEQKTRLFVEEIAILTGQSYDTVMKVMEGIRLVTLHDLFEQGLADEEAGVIGSKWVDITLPRISTVILTPINRTKTAEGLDGYTFKGKVHFQDKFLQDAKKAYYEHYDVLLDHCKEVFSEALVEKYKSIL